MAWEWPHPTLAEERSVDTVRPATVPEALLCAGCHLCQHMGHPPHFRDGHSLYFPGGETEALREVACPMSQERGDTLRIGLQYCKLVTENGNLSLHVNTTGWEPWLTKAVSELKLQEPNMF